MSEQVFDKLKMLSPYSIVKQALKMDESLKRIDREKLFVSAAYISDTLNFRLFRDHDYQIQKHTLNKNLSRVLKAWGLSTKQFRDRRRQILLQSKELVELKPDEKGLFTVLGRGPWNRHFAWLRPSQIKLHYLKGLINSGAKIVPSLLQGERVEEAKEPVSIFINKVTQRLKKALSYEQGKGLLPPSRDRNMELVMKAVHESLVYICEIDNYYRAWIAYLCMVIWEEMQVFYDSFNLEMLQKDLVGNQIHFEKNGKTIEIAEMFSNPLTKKQLFSWFLSKHLPYLPKYEITIKDV